MKTKTFKLIATITAFTLLGTAVGVSAFALNNSTDNDFGFKGSYSLNAFADVATVKSKDVDGVNVDVTDTLVLVSLDKEQPYTLFVSVIDSADLNALTNVTVGYELTDESTYNGTESGASNVVYSSLTIIDSDTSGQVTFNASDYADKSNEDKTSKITQPVFVVAEVLTEKVGLNEASLVINGRKLI